MPDNQEQIESQLCAYVDDALDAKDQAEIERHLEANPQHRRLLDDLKMGRDLLRGLPRESAPAELTESFTGQLERSALLDGMGSPEPERRLRIHKLPQIAAAAAIVLLASGLGAVVYFAMPSGRSVVASTQVVPPVAKAAPPSDSPAALPHDALRDTAPLLEPVPSEKKPGDAAPLADDRLAVAGESAGEKENAVFQEADPEKLEAVAKDVSNNRYVQEMLYGKPGDSEAAATQAAPRAAVVMVVNSRDPNETRKQLAEYFTTNNIAWAPAPAAEPAKLGKVAGEMAGALAAAAAPAKHGEPAPQNDAPLAKPADNAKTGSDASADGQTAPEPANAALPVIPSAPSAAPAPVAQAAPSPQAPSPVRGAGGAGEGQASVQLGAPIAQNYDRQDQDAGLGRLYVARNVSRRQAAELGKNLNRAGTEQAQLFANAFESNHLAAVRDLAAAGTSNDLKDARERTIAPAAQSLDQAGAQSADSAARLAAKGGETTPPATQPQVAEANIAEPAGKAAVQPEAGQLQRQARELPAAAPESQRRYPQFQQSAARAVPHSYANASGGASDEGPRPYALAQQQDKKQVAAPATAPANAEEAINAPQAEPATDNPVDLVIVVQSGAKEAPASTFAPPPATQPAEQTVPAK